MTAEKILFVTQEISPYVPDSELTNLGYNLPNTTIETGREARIFMPKWGNINERRNQLHPVQRISGMNLVVDDTDYQLIITTTASPPPSNSMNPANTAKARNTPTTSPVRPSMPGAFWKR